MLGSVPHGRQARREHARWVVCVYWECSDLAFPLCGFPRLCGILRRKRLRVVAGTDMLVPCPWCGRRYTNLGQHYRWSERCHAASLALEASDEEDSVKEQGELEALLDDAAACDVADGLASLKYEHGFNRPDVVAAKSFANTVGKRTRECAFESLQGVLRPDVTRSEFECAVARTKAGINLNH